MFFVQTANGLNIEHDSWSFFNKISRHFWISFSTKYYFLHHHGLRIFYIINNYYIPNLPNIILIVRTRKFVFSYFQANSVRWSTLWATNIKIGTIWRTYSRPSRTTRAPCRWNFTCKDRVTRTSCWLRNRHHHRRPATRSLSAEEPTAFATYESPEGIIIIFIGFKIKLYDYRISIN